MIQVVVCDENIPWELVVSWKKYLWGNIQLIKVDYE